MTRSGKYIEVQGTAEKALFSQKQLNGLLRLAKIGVKQVIQSQEMALKQ
jgi:ribonuclease PH